MLVIFLLATAVAQGNRPLYQWVFAGQNDANRALLDPISSLKFLPKNEAHITASGLKLTSQTQDSAITEHDLPVGPPGSKTLAAWLVFSQSSPSGCIFSLDESYDDSPFKYNQRYFDALCLEKGKLCIESENGKRSGSASNAPLPQAGVPVHVAVSYDVPSSIVSIYENGQIVGSVQTEEPPKAFDTKSRIILGKSSFSGTDNGDVTIQSLQVFDSSLNSADIAALAQTAALAMLQCNGESDYMKVRDFFFPFGSVALYPGITDDLAGTHLSGSGGSGVTTEPFETAVSGFNRYLIQRADCVDGYVVVDKSMLNYEPPLASDYYTVVLDGSSLGTGIEYSVDLLWKTNSGDSEDPVIRDSASNLLYAEDGQIIDGASPAYEVWIRNFVKDDNACFTIDALPLQPWELKRHLPVGSTTWFTALDDLSGSAPAVGTGPFDVTNTMPFTIPFTNAEAEDFLFATSRCEKWIIFKRATLQAALGPCGSGVCTTNVQAEKSYLNPLSHLVTVSKTALGTVIVRYREISDFATVGDQDSELTSRIYVDNSATDFIQNPFAFGSELFVRKSEFQPTSTPTAAPTNYPTRCLNNIKMTLFKEIGDRRPHFILKLPCDFHCWVKVKFTNLAEIRNPRRYLGKRRNYPKYQYVKKWNLQTKVIDHDVVLGVPAKKIRYWGTILTSKWKTVDFSFTTAWLYSPVKLPLDDGGGMRVRENGVKFSFEIDWPWLRSRRGRRRKSGLHALRIAIDVIVSRRCTRWHHHKKVRRIHGHHFDEFVFDKFLYFISPNDALPDHFKVRVTEREISDRHYRLYYDFVLTRSTPRNPIPPVKYDPYFKIYDEGGTTADDIEGVPEVNFTSDSAPQTGEAAATSGFLRQPVQSVSLGILGMICGIVVLCFCCWMYRLRKSAKNEMGSHHLDMYFQTKRDIGPVVSDPVDSDVLDEEFELVTTSPESGLRQPSSEVDVRNG